MTSHALLTRTLALHCRRLLSTSRPVAPSAPIGPSATHNAHTKPTAAAAAAAASSGASSVDEEGEDDPLPPSVPPAPELCALQVDVGVRSGAFVAADASLAGGLEGFESEADRVSEILLELGAGSIVIQVRP